MKLALVGFSAALLLAVSTQGSSQAVTSAGSPVAAAASTEKYAPIPDGPITFGVLLPLSGPLAESGKIGKASFEKAAMPLFKYLHPKGIAGHPVQLKFYDSPDATGAVSAAKQAVADKVAGVVAVTYDGSVAPLQLAVLMKAKVPVVAVTVGLDQYSDVTKYPYFFSVFTSNNQNAVASSRWIARRPDIKTVAILGDGTQGSVELINDFKAALAKNAPRVRVVGEVGVSPGSVDVSAQIAQLKALKPDLVLVELSYGFGTVWQAMNAAGWTSKILMPPSAFYDGYNAIGNLANNTFSFYSYCLANANAKFPPLMNKAMDSYMAATGGFLVNYAQPVAGDSGPLELFKTAIEKINSVDPNGIKTTLETMGKVGYFTNAIQFQYTPRNHYGVTGPGAATVCRATPLVGKYKSPLIAP